MHRSLLVIFCCLASFLGGINDSLVYRFKKQHEVAHEQVTEGGVQIGYNSKRLPYHFYFLYSPAVNAAYKEKSADDSKWTVVSADASLDLDEIPFNGAGTFRLHYRFTDSTMNVPVVCELFQRGASEVYIDGRLIKKFGKIGADSKSEDPLIPRYEPFYIQHPDTQEHVLTILFSNHNGLMKRRNDKGIELKFYTFEDYEEESTNFDLLHKFLIGLFAFFGALAVVHLFLFFADRGRRFNLFYSLFLLMVSFTALWPVIIAYTESPDVYFFMNKTSMLFLPACLFFLLNLMYSFFQRRFNFFYWLNAGMFAFFIVAYFLKWEPFAGIAYAALFFTIYFGVTILAIKALRKKYSGSLFLGWGILSFTILFVLGIVLMIATDEDAYLFGCTTLSVLALPLSMTAYLSYDFARTNKSLKEQLAANEELSRKTIEQEKEKQEILANQNKMLEQQVEERTREINEQKNLLEEKQTEILDSIRYAKRIQNSLMPTEKFITRTISRLRNR